MKSSIVNFKTISLAKVFAEIHIRKVSRLLKTKSNLVARYDTNSLAFILQDVGHQEVELLLKSLRKMIKSEAKTLGFKMDVDLSFAMDDEFTSPIDLLMLASNNLEQKA